MTIPVFPPASVGPAPTPTGGPERTRQRARLGAGADILLVALVPTVS